MHTQRLYYKITVSAPAHTREIVYEALSALPLTGIEEYENHFVAYFPHSLPLEELHSTFQSLEQRMFDIRLVSIESYHNPDWYHHWIQDLTPIRISERLTIVPPEISPPAEAVLPITIARRSAFGTGDHPTTQLCLRYLEQLALPNHRWIDAGTGSGICAITLARLGVRTIIAVDNDPIAIEEAQRNAQLNRVQHAIDFLTVDLQQWNFPPADGIVANLYLHLHQQLLPAFATSLTSGGHLICSGVLQEDQDDLLQLLYQADFHPRSVGSQNGWIAVWSQKQ